MSIVIEQIMPERVSLVWPHMEAYFDRACRRVPTHLTAANIRSRAEANQASVWAIYDAAEPLPLLGAASTFVRNAVVTIECLGGRQLRTWMRAALEEFETLARQHGMNEIEIEGRFGWQRLLPCYVPKRIAMRKTL